MKDAWDSFIYFLGYIFLVLVLAMMLFGGSMSVDNPLIK